jgi:protein-tyrosine kinase
VSRVFDALRATGPSSLRSEPLSPIPFVDTLEKNFQLEPVSTVNAQLGPESRLVFHTEPNGPAAERYRLICHRLRAAHVQANVKTLLITSPGTGEGKSTVSLNLAVSLAEKGKQHVLLLEGDLRRPSLQRELGLRLSSGLTQCARNEVALASAIWRIQPFGIYFLPAGEIVDDPAELLTSESFSALTAQLVASFDWMIIDTPPAIPVVDALSLKRYADASIVVAWAGRTQQTAIAEVIRVLGRNHVMGVVLNGLETLDRGYYECYEYHGGKK